MDETGRGRGRGRQRRRRRRRRRRRQAPVVGDEGLQLAARAAAAEAVLLRRASIADGRARRVSRNSRMNNARSDLLEVVPSPDKLVGLPPPPPPTPPRRAQPGEVSPEIEPPEPPDLSCMRWIGRRLGGCRGLGREGCTGFKRAVKGRGVSHDKPRRR
jgi:hypothetical protein